MHGANVNGTDKTGLTALMKATSRKDIDRAETLVNNGADINAINQDGETALMMAVKTSSGIFNEDGEYVIDILKLLCENEVDLNAARFSDGRTTLMLAAEINDFQVTRTLLKNEVYKHLRDDYGLRAIDLATDHVVKV